MLVFQIAAGPLYAYQKSMLRYVSPLACSLFLTVSALGNPVISEFMADNKSTLADENGDFSDWIEIHNPAATPFALGGWYLTDTATTLAKWQFPAVTLEPGEFLIVWASGKNRRVPGAPLHTNFSLAKSGEFLALVQPNGTTTEQSFAPKFPAQATDQSYGARFVSTPLLAGNSPARYGVPTSATDPAAAWNQVGFDDSSWSLGPGGFGYGLIVPGVTVRQVRKNGSISGLNDALALLALPPNDPGILSSSSLLSPTVNFLGDGPDGHFALNQAFPVSSDNFATAATGTLTIPTAGVYTFGINSDDGGQILIDGVEVMRDDTFHGPQDAFGSVSLSAGPHTFRAVMFEGGGGECFEFFAAPGTHASFGTGNFRLVGDEANGGLASSTTPPSVGGIIGTDIAVAQAGQSSAYVRVPFTAAGPLPGSSLSLVMRYKDGFAAQLNGGFGVSSNAPTPLLWDSTATAARSQSQSLQRQGFNLTAALPALVNGPNVLTLQSLKASIADPAFLISSELILGSLDAAAPPAPYGLGLATPGWINGTPSSLGNVADTEFSTKRGFYTAPLSVSITSLTPGASIRYTTDGSIPTDTHGALYTAPVAISTTTVLRARAFLAGWTATGVDTQTYLFPDDVLTQSSAGTPPPGWPTASGTSQVLDYGMDPDIVNHPNPSIGGAATVKAALLSLPSISVTTDLPNLFNIGGSQGIYANPYERGFGWERPASMEWIAPPDATHPNGRGEFQINAGVRIRGGYSRSTDNPKHALRFFFREEYGAAKLNYPLFGPKAAQEFDKIDLRTAQNYSWSFFGDSRNTFLREEACRQAMLDMGQPGSHVRYAHLYLNGHYWGLYNLDERTEAAFSASYLGGNKDDYDVVKSESESGHTTGATDGNLAAWQSLWTQGKLHRTAPTNANYFRMMGLAADGTTPTADPVLLDPDNLIDYLLLTFWSGNFDGCVSAFLSNDRANNWFGSRRRVNNTRQGFRFFVHDFEHSLFNPYEDRTGPFTSANEANFAFSNPLFLHQDLIANEEYRLRWADRIHRHLFQDGKLTSNAWQSRINQLATQVEPAIAAESARWGDAKSPTSPFTKLDWTNAKAALLYDIPPRNAIVLDQLRADGLYPVLDAPEFSPYGGRVPVGTQISILAPPAATLHYMPDGSDPRAIGGALRPGALALSPATLTLTNVGERTLRFRARSGTTWSALSEVTYQVGTILPTPADLIVSEINYFPPDPFGNAEFIELLNTHPTAILDLAGAKFTEGIDFTFPPNTNLYPGGRLLVIKDTAAFETLHGTGRPIAGLFQNGSGLSNTGERLRLLAADDTPLLDFSYATTFPWPTSANGLGRSIVLTDPSTPNNPSSWRPSAGLGGNPGTSDALPLSPGQDLLDYALTAGSPPKFDATTGTFSVTRRLGADATTLTPEWSANLTDWFTQSLTLTADTPDSGGNPTLQWKLDPLPPGQAFIRLRVSEKP